VKIRKSIFIHSQLFKRQGEKWVTVKLKGRLCERFEYMTVSAIPCSKMQTVMDWQNKAVVLNENVEGIIPIISKGG